MSSKDNVAVAVAMGPGISSDSARAGGVRVTVCRMVIEVLTFSITPEDRPRWLAREAEVWSRFLEGQDGFVRKEVWCSDEDVTDVKVIIWWESMEQWKSIGPDRVAEVDEAMGDLLVEPSCQAFHLLREG